MGGTQCSRQNFEIGGCRGVESRALVSNPPPIFVSVTIVQSIAVYLQVYNCLVTIEYRSAVHAIILMGGASASETLIGGYICTIGGCSTPKNSLERTLVVRTCVHFLHTHQTVHFSQQLRNERCSTLDPLHKCRCNGIQYCTWKR